jgi:hypothetical protein
MKKIIHDLLYVLPKPGLKHFFIGKIAFLLLISLSLQAAPMPPLPLPMFRVPLEAPMENHSVALASLKKVRAM